jgi:hypothetical protein
MPCHTSHTRLTSHFCDLLSSPQRSTSVSWQEGHPDPGDSSKPIGSMVLLYMVTFTINIPQMLAYILYIYIYTIHGSYGKGFRKFPKRRIRWIPWGSRPQVVPHSRQWPSLATLTTSLNESQMGAVAKDGSTACIPSSIHFLAVHYALCHNYS